VNVVADGNTDEVLFVHGLVPSLASAVALFLDAPVPGAG
jgi:hypothetical protein